MNHSSGKGAGTFIWSELPPLPPAPGQIRQPGVAAPFVGTHEAALIVAGGANFPTQAPWLGGKKTWWDRVWVLAPGPNGRLDWCTGPDFRLPRPLAYGVSFSTPTGVVCVGGTDANSCRGEAFILRWDPDARGLRIAELPALPTGLGFGGGAAIGSSLYVVGGAESVDGTRPSNRLWRLDLARRGRTNLRWEELPPLPGSPRILPVVASQRYGAGPELFVFSGRFSLAGKPSQLLTDAYRFEPTGKRWTTLAPIKITPSDELGELCLMGATVVSAGDRELFVFGGDRGDNFRRLEAFDLEIEDLGRQLDGAAADSAKLRAEIDRRLQAKNAIYVAHPGFSDDILAYDTLTDRWRRVGQMPMSGPVTTQAVAWRRGWVIPTGEERPGIRTRRILSFELSAVPVSATLVAPR